MASESLLDQVNSFFFIVGLFLLAASASFVQSLSQDDDKKQRDDRDDIASSTDDPQDGRQRARENSLLGLNEKSMLQTLPHFVRSMLSYFDLNSLCRIFNLENSRRQPDVLVNIQKPCLFWKYNDDAIGESLLDETLNMKKCNRKPRAMGDTFDLVDQTTVTAPSDKLLWPNSLNNKADRCTMAEVGGKGMACFAPNKEASVVFPKGFSNKQEDGDVQEKLPKNKDKSHNNQAKTLPNLKRERRAQNMALSRCLPNLNNVPHDAASPSESDGKELLPTFLVREEYFEGIGTGSFNSNPDGGILVKTANDEHHFSSPKNITQIQDWNKGLGSATKPMKNPSRIEGVSAKDQQTNIFGSTDDLKTIELTLSKKSCIDRIVNPDRENSSRLFKQKLEMTLQRASKKYQEKNVENPTSSSDSKMSEKSQHSCTAEESPSAKDFQDNKAKPVNPSECVKNLFLLKGRKIENEDQPHGIKDHCTERGILNELAKTQSTRQATDTTSQSPLCINTEIQSPISLTSVIQSLKRTKKDRPQTSKEEDDLSTSTKINNLSPQQADQNMQANKQGNHEGSFKNRKSEAIVQKNNYVSPYNIPSKAI